MTSDRRWYLSSAMYMASRTTLRLNPSLDLKLSEIISGLDTGFAANRGQGKLSQNCRSDQC